MKTLGGMRWPTFWEQLRLLLLLMALFLVSVVAGIQFVLWCLR